MSRDIVDKLREVWEAHDPSNESDVLVATLVREAADEIERLRRIVPGGASTVGSDKWRDVMRHWPKLEVIDAVDEKTAREIAEEKALAAIALIEEVANRRR